MNGNLENEIHEIECGNSRERRNAARNLVAIGETAIVPLIKVLRSAEIGATRANAAWALGEIGGPRVREQLKIALNDADPKVRKRAAEALGKNGVVVVKLAFSYTYINALLISPCVSTWSRFIKLHSQVTWCVLATANALVFALFVYLAYAKLLSQSFTALLFVTILGCMVIVGCIIGSYWMITANKIGGPRPSGYMLFMVLILAPVIGIFAGGTGWENAQRRYSAESTDGVGVRRYVKQGEAVEITEETVRKYIKGAAAQRGDGVFEIQEVLFPKHATQLPETIPAKGRIEPQTWGSTITLTFKPGITGWNYERKELVAELTSPTFPDDLVIVQGVLKMPVLTAVISEKNFSNETVNVESRSIRLAFVSSQKFTELTTSDVVARNHGIFWGVVCAATPVYLIFLFLFLSDRNPEVANR